MNNDNTSSVGTIIAPIASTANSDALKARKAKGKVKVKATKKVAKKVQKALIRKSKVAKPCKVVWQIMKSMPSTTRKEILARCEKRGIATYTATTQFQAHRAMLQVFVTKGIDLAESED